jgi:L-amino acid N-acyltransferase YncA
VSDATIVRDALLDDAEAICAIYNQGIEDRSATLETTLRDASERRQWLSERSERHPVLLAERDGVVLGWASLNAFNPRAAYAHVGDFSIYIERGQRGTGFGRILLDALEKRARVIGFRKLVLAMFDWNTAGITLYQRAGFRTVGTYREHGQLDGRWVDVLLMEKLLH